MRHMRMGMNERQEAGAGLSTSASPQAAAPTDEAKNPLLVALGERVRKLRAQRGLTRKAVALAAGISERHLANLEYGTGNASILVLQPVAGGGAGPLTAGLAGVGARPRTGGAPQGAAVAPRAPGAACAAQWRGRSRQAQPHCLGGSARRRQIHARAAAGARARYALRRTEPRDRIPRRVQRQGNTQSVWHHGLPPP